MAHDKKDAIYTKEMSGEEFAHAFLKNIEERAEANFGQEISSMRPLEILVKKTLGLPVPENDALPAAIQQIKHAPEFPCHKAKYRPDGTELARKLCESLEMVTELNRQGFHYWVDIDAPLPPGSTLVE